jgi:hypothetical protein
MGNLQYTVSVISEHESVVLSSSLFQRLRGDESRNFLLPSNQSTRTLGEPVYVSSPTVLTATIEPRCCARSQRATLFRRVSRGKAIYDRVSRGKTRRLEQEAMNSNIKKHPPKEAEKPGENGSFDSLLRT